MKGIGGLEVLKKNFEWVPFAAPRSDLYRLSMRQESHPLIII